MRRIYKMLEYISIHSSTQELTERAAEAVKVKLYFNSQLHAGADICAWLSQ